MATLARLLGDGDALADLPEEVVDVVGHLGKGDGGVAAGVGVGCGAKEPGGFAGRRALVALDVVEVFEADEGVAAEGAAEAETVLLQGEGAAEQHDGEDAEEEAEGQLVGVNGADAVVQEQREVDGERVDGEESAAEEEGEGGGGKGIDEIGWAEAVAVRAWLAAAGDEGGEEAHEGLQQKFHVFGG